MAGHIPPRRSGFMRRLFRLPLLSLCATQMRTRHRHFGKLFHNIQKLVDGIDGELAENSVLAQPGFRFGRVFLEAPFTSDGGLNLSKCWLAGEFLLGRSGFTGGPRRYWFPVEVGNCRSGDVLQRVAEFDRRLLLCRGSWIEGGRRSTVIIKIGNRGSGDILQRVGKSDGGLLLG